MENEEITLTKEEANYILTLLSELPIKHLAIVRCVQQFLNSKLQRVCAETPLESSN